MDMILGPLDSDFEFINPALFYQTTVELGGNLQETDY